MELALPRWIRAFDWPTLALILVLEPAHFNEAGQKREKPNTRVSLRLRRNTSAENASTVTHSSTHYNCLAETARGNNSAAAPSQSARGGLFVRRSNGRTRVAAGVYMGGRTLQKVGQGAAARRSWYRAQFLPGSCSEWRRVLLAFSALVFLRSLSDTRVFGFSLFCRR